MPDPDMPQDALDPARWRDNTAFLYGIDLFNAGFYWEAHEVWEGLWRAAERDEPAAPFLKGLIALAAAGVKALEARPEGVRRHAARARDLFIRCRAMRDDPDASFFGLSPDELIRLAEEMRGRAEGAAAARRVDVLAGVFLRPAGGS